MTCDKKVDRPLLKGIFHLIAAIIYALKLSSLTEKIPMDLEVPLKLYLMSIICNFGFSTLLHIIPWSDDTVCHLRRLDHIMIFMLIVGTYGAGISTIMHDINELVIYVLFTGIILGIISRLFFTDAPAMIIGIPYLIVGWAILLDPYTLMLSIDRIPSGFIIGLSAGLSYTLGACIYITKSPQLWPKYMGYHELFHVFTIIGTVLFTICIFDHAIPYHNHRILI
jgi:hemolysin III